MNSNNDSIDLGKTGALIDRLPETKSPLTQKEIENLPEFKVWADAKKIEAKNYVWDAFALEVQLEDLLIWRDDAGWPDTIGRAGSHKQIVANQKFRDKDNNILGNYNVWRKLPVSAETTT